MRRLLLLAPLVALLVTNCGMSDEKFQEKIRTDVRETAIVPYKAGYNYIIQKSRQISAIPEPKTVNDILEIYTRGINDPATVDPAFKELREKIDKYSGVRREQARHILVNSCAYSSAYGEALAITLLQTSGQKAWMTEMNIDLSMEFVDEFFMPNVFPTIYEFAVPKINEVDGNLLLSGQGMKEYSAWVIAKMLTQ